MPWKASSVMEERLRFVPRLLDGEARHARWTGKYPWRPGRMARRRTCNLQHSMFGRQVRSTDGRCPIGYPAPGPGRWVGRRLICKECGTAGSVIIVPNWHDRAGHAVPFTKHWKTWDSAFETDRRPTLRRPWQGRPAPPRTRTRFRTRSGRSDHIEKINGPLLFGDKGAPGEYQRRPGARRHTGLVGIARIRNLRKVHNDWRRSVRL